jgi:ABC-type transport system substrate-binding protein
MASDRLSITFKLRKGVKFHDGTVFNAEAAKYNMDHWLAKGGSQVAGWKSIDIIDDYTIRLNLTDFKNTILSQLASSTGKMVSPTAIETNGKDWAEYHPVGTGPYEFKSFVRDTSLDMERFDGYWGAKPYLDVIKYIFIVDPMVGAMALQAGEAQVFMIDEVQDMGRDLEKKGYQIILSPLGMRALIPDSIHPDSPLADKRVREAVEYAIDKESIAKTLGQGYWRAYYQIAPDHAFGYVPELEAQGRKYDPTKAKQLLAEAGYPNGFKTFVITKELIGNNPLLAVQANLKAVGIDLELKVVSEASYQEYMFKGWSNGFHYGDPSAVEPNFCAFLQRFYQTGCMWWPSLKKPAELDELINQALAAPDFESQKALCQEAVKVAFDDAMVIPCWSFIHGYAVDKTVHDTGFGEYASPAFWDYGKTWLSK